MNRILSFSAAILSGFAACSRPLTTVPPDLTIRIECARRLTSVDEIALEKTLYLAGFDVLNRARLARESGGKFEPPLTIDAVTSKGDIVAITGLDDHVTGHENNPSFHMTVSVYSPPGQPHDSKLKSYLEALAAKAPACTIRASEWRPGQGAQPSEFKAIAKYVRDRFDLAKTVSPQSDTRREHSRS